MSGNIDKINISGIDVPIIYEKSDLLPIVSLQLIVKKAGSIEDGKIAGLARFTSGVLNEGSKNKGSTEFARELENRAINLSVHAGSETFVYELSSLKEQYSFGVKMLKELMSDPNFSKDSFSKVRQLTLGSLSSKQSNFDYLASLNLKKLIFRDTPIGHASSGEMEGIKKLNLSDVENFYNSHIDLSNMIVVVGGDINIDEVKSSLKELLSDVKVGSPRKLGFYISNDEEKEIVVKKETEQAYLYFGAPYNLKSSDKNNYKSKVAGFILGESGFGSRLMEEIRVKKGLAYSVYSRNNIGSSNAYFSGYLQTKIDNLDKAKKIIKSEIARFVKDGVSENELDQAKNFLLGSEPLRNETLSQRLSRAFFEYYHGFELGHSKSELKKIEKLTLKDLNDFIKSHDEITKLSFSIVTK